MNTLTLHIEYLLLKHDCVIVPGLGALLNVRQPARYDEERKLWLPMTREVRFNAALTHDDGLLASSYARKEQVSYAEGREMLGDAVHKLLATLRQESLVTLGRIGTLSTHEGTLVFSPRHDSKRLINILGYHEAPVSKPDSETSLQEELADEIGCAPVNKIAEESSIASEGRKFDTERNYYIAVNKTFARVAACLAIILITSLAFVLPPNTQTNVDKASVVPVEQMLQPRAPKASAPTNKADIEINEQRAEQVEEPEGRYHAIIATFATPAEAEAFVSARSSASSELRVVNGRTKSRVSAFSTDNREEATRRISETSFKQEYGDAWIWDAE
jgi:hypothetical protein